MGLSMAYPRPTRTSFDLPRGPDPIVLSQKNVEAVCSAEAEVPEKTQRTVIHELCHYFGMTEQQLTEV